jgi:hypothetical protein
VITGKIAHESNLVIVDIMQWVLLYMFIGHGNCHREHLAQHGCNGTEHHHACTTSVLWRPVAHLPAALTGHVRGNFGSGCLQADVAEHVGLPNSHQQSLPTH